MLMTPEMYYLLKMYRIYDGSSLLFLRANADMNTLWKDMYINNGDYTKEEIEKINLDYKKSKNIKVLNYISHRTGKSEDDVFSFLQENKMEDFGEFNFIELCDKKKKANQIISERLFHFSSLSFLQRIKIKKEIKEKNENGEFLKNNPVLEFVKIYVEKGFIKWSELYNDKNISFLLKTKKYELLKIIMDNAFKENKVNFDSYLFLKQIVLEKFENKIDADSIFNISEEDKKMKLIKDTMEIANIAKDFPQKYIEQMINDIDNLDFSYDISKIGFRIPFVEEERMGIKDKSIGFRKYLKMHLESLYLKKEFIIPEYPKLTIEKRKRL